MPRKREQPRAWETSWIHNDQREEGDWTGVSSPDPQRLVGHGSTRSDTEWEALMRCAPGNEPDVSVDVLLPLRDIIEDAKRCLTEEERDVFEMVFTERLSLRKLGMRMGFTEPPYGKTSVARIRDITIQKMRDALQDVPAIKDYLNGL